MTKVARASATYRDSYCGDVAIYLIPVTQRTKRGTRAAYQWRNDPCTVVPFRSINGLDRALRVAKADRRIRDVRLIPDF